MNETIRKIIEEYVAGYPEGAGTVTRWQPPLVAFAAADDPLFPEVHNQVSPTHALPADLLVDARTVIVYFIPFHEDVVTSNIAGVPCSREWAVAYIETNRLIADLNQHLAGWLAGRGYSGVATPATHNFDPQKLISDWSHRHIAYIAGLGSFGLNNMLITAKGCCGRLGSLVTNLIIEPTPRTGVETCLYKQRGLCRKCVGRCVNAALTEEGFDRHRCYAMCLVNADRYSELGLTDVCGKCLVNVPCSRLSPGG